MRVIKEGKIIVKENKKTCSKCKAIFAYMSADVNPDRDGDYVVCPTCKSFIAV